MSELNPIALSLCWLCKNCRVRLCNASFHFTKHSGENEIITFCLLRQIRTCLARLAYGTDHANGMHASCTPRIQNTVMRVNVNTFHLASAISELKTTA